MGKVERHGVTISALTNQDAADISRAVRERMKARGELGGDEIVHQAVDQRGETYDLPIARGDKVRLFRKTWGRIGGEGPGFIGSNGDVVEVLGQSAEELRLRNADGQVADVAWNVLKDLHGDRLLLGFGHALTIDSAQGITSGEHINALPRGTAGITAFKSYVAESRHVSQVWTILSEAVAFEAVRCSRALGDKDPITPEHLWAQIAKDMSQKPYKSLAGDLVAAIERGQEADVDRFIRTEHRVFTQEEAGRDHGTELRARLRGQELRRVLQQHIGPLTAALDRREEAIRQLGEGVDTFPETLRVRMRTAVIAMEEQQEAERAASAPTRLTGFSPRM